LLSPLYMQYCAFTIGLSPYVWREPGEPAKICAMLRSSRSSNTERVLRHESTVSRCVAAAQLQLYSFVSLLLYAREAIVVLHGFRSYQ